MNRRDCLTLLLKGGVVGAAVGVLQPQPASGVIRPPGAVEQFLSLCSRCGLCVQSCPYPTLSLAGLLDKAENGTPFIDPQFFPCQMCEDIPCASSCPTGALTKPASIAEARMGMAEVEPSCLTYRGEACDKCVVACPVEAITLQPGDTPKPTVNDRCTGCGQCEYACVTASRSIKVHPRDLAR